MAEDRPQRVEVRRVDPAGGVFSDRPIRGVSLAGGGCLLAILLAVLAAVASLIALALGAVTGIAATAGRVAGRLARIRSRFSAVVRKSDNGVER